MAKILPFRRSNESREAILQTADILFNKYNIDYQIDESALAFSSLVELVTGKAKLALIETSRLSIERRNFIQYLWQNRSIAQKISDSFKGRHFNAVFPAEAYNFMHKEENYALHDRSIKGQLFIGNNRTLEPAEVVVTDRYLTGTLSIIGQQYELNPSDRLVKVDVRIPSSDKSKYDSLISYSLYPDEVSVQLQHTRIFEDSDTRFARPLSSSNPSFKLHDMVSTIYNTSFDESN